MKRIEKDISNCNECPYKRETRTVLAHIYCELSGASTFVWTDEGSIKIAWTNMFGTCHLPDKQVSEFKAPGCAYAMGQKECEVG